MIKRIPLFYQYLISYTTLLLIPLIIIGSVVYGFLVNYLTEHVKANHDRILEQISHTLDANYEEMINISVKLAMKPELSPYNLTNFYNAYAMKSAMDYQEGNELIHDIILYIRDHPFLYSSKTSYSMPIFYKTHHYTNWDFDDFYETMNTLSTPVFRSSEEVIYWNQPKQFLTLLVPIPYRSYEPYGTALFLIDEAVLRERFRSIVQHSGSQVFVLDGEGRVVTQLNEENEWTVEELNQFALHAEKMQSETDTIAWKKQNYIISQVTSPVTKWRYVTLVPEAEAMSTINGVKNKTLISVGLVLAIGIILIYVSMHLHYFPIQLLIKSVEHKFGVDSRSSHGIDKVRLALTQMDSKLHEQARHHQPVLQQHLLIQLLKGRFSDKEEFIRQAGELQLRFSGTAYFSMVLQIHPNKSSNRMEPEQFAKRWLTYLPDTMDGYFVDMFEDDQFTFILSDEAEHAQWSALHRKFVEDHNLSVTIGIGNRYADLIDISKSYMEAATALQYRWIKGNNTVIFFHETKTDAHVIQWYPHSLIEQLETLMIQQNTEDMKNVVEEIIDAIRLHSSTLLMAKYLCVDVINKVMQTLNKLQIPLHADAPVPDVLSMTRYESIQDIEEIVRHVCQTAAASIERHKQIIAKDDLVQNILLYIEDNYTSIQFSLQQVSDHFLLSVTSLGKRFKLHTGKTIMEHVDQLRIAKAKELLARSDLQLKEIVERVGYCDVSSFIRKFKQKTGMTPGQYRSVTLKIQE